ncbi:MAG: alpha/beta hydrolase, partial [bacterium]|nr:alpha/beta hydrolase [bacterium]
EQFLSDTHDLLELLKVRFSQQKIFLVGHSWGSVLGLETAHRHPELLHAYVGMGQVVDMRRGEELSYRYTLAKAHEAGNTGAVKMLENLGPPPYEGGFQSLSTQRMLLAQFGGTFRRISYPQLLGYSQTSPHYSEGDLATWMRSFTNTQEIMWKNIGGIGFANRIREIKVPVFFFCGRYDQQTPSELVNDYYKSLKASLKRIVWFEESGHMPNIEEPDKYQNVLIETVLVETLRFESEKK